MSERMAELELPDNAQCSDCGGTERHTGDCGQWRKDIDSVLIMSALCPGSLIRLFSMTSDGKTAT